MFAVIVAENKETAKDDDDVGDWHQDGGHYSSCLEMSWRRGESVNVVNT